MFKDYVIQFEGEIVLKQSDNDICGVQPDGKTIVAEFKTHKHAHDYAMELWNECLSGIAGAGYRVFECRRVCEKRMKNFLGDRYDD